MSAVGRRQFLIGAGALASSSLLRAQNPGTVRRIALLMGTAKGTSKDSHGNAQASALRDALRQLGWIEGRNLRIEYRWGEGDAKLMRSQAEELVAGRPEIILAQTATALREVQRAAGAIPIVFWTVSDPVGNKFVSNLSRPGGNTTGFSLFEYEMGGKWLQLLKEVTPRLRRVFLLMSVRNPNWPGWRRAIELAAPSLGLQVEHIELTDVAQIGPAVSAFAQKPNGGLVVLPDPFLSPQREAIVMLAAKHRLPAIYGPSAYTQAGGLISYGIDSVDLARRAASYVDRILKGEKPGDLPIQKPTKFELEINLGAAKALGLQIPQSVLLRADRVIE